MYLLIDYREYDFIKKLSEFAFIENDIVKTIKINNIELIFKVCSLPIGDFIIKESLDNNSDSSIQVIIERKSINDLCSSITDGRFREQKLRLLESINDSKKITYIIEGNKTNLKQRLSQNVINGSILNLIYKHNYNVISTENKLDTFNNIILLYKKLKGKEFGECTQNQNIVKLIKKSDSMQSNKLINTLTLIPGISLNISNIIISDLSKNENFNLTIKSIIDKYNDLENEVDKELLFCEIIISNKNGKIRKIGKCLSKKIYEFFCK